MSDKYEIKSVADFIKVPDEKLSECLRDFASWCDFHREMRDLLDGIEMHEETFIWVDDGKPGISSIKIIAK